jgi:predicted esterase
LEPQPIEASIQTPIHGRYLVRPVRSASVALVGFHGYGEAAEAQFQRLAAIPGSDACVLISIQGLHRFYERRTDRVVASWMTRQDRELAIADNLAYVSGVLHAVLNETTVESVVFAGFSQGVAMAFRAAVASTARVRHVIAVGGDVPPELDAAALSGLSSTLICRGAEDPFYTREMFDKDVERLTDARVRVDALTVAGGHEWSSAVTDAGFTFLRDSVTAGSGAV